MKVTSNLYNFTSGKIFLKSIDDYEKKIENDYTEEDFKNYNLFKNNFINSLDFNFHYNNEEFSKEFKSSEHIKIMAKFLVENNKTDIIKKISVNPSKFVKESNKKLFNKSVEKYSKKLDGKKIDFEVNETYKDFCLNIFTTTENVDVDMMKKNVSEFSKTKRTVIELTKQGKTSIIDSSVSLKHQAIIENLYINTQMINNKNLITLLNELEGKDLKNYLSFSYNAIKEKLTSVLDKKNFNVEKLEEMTNILNERNKRNLDIDKKLKDNSTAPTF